MSLQPCEYRPTDTQVRDASNWEFSHDFGEMDTRSDPAIRLFKPVMQLAGKGVTVLPRGADPGCAVKIGLLPNSARKNYLWSLREFLRCLLALLFPITLIHGNLWQLDTKQGK